jgi:hypothetical protein
MNSCFLFLAKPQESSQGRTSLAAGDGMPTSRSSEIAVQYTTDADAVWMREAIASTESQPSSYQAVSASRSQSGELSVVILRLAYVRASPTASVINYEVFLASGHIEIPNTTYDTLDCDRCERIILSLTQATAFIS